MVFHAVEALDKAIDETKDILTPFSIVDWAKLALALILAGAGASMFGGFQDIELYSDLATEPGLSMGAIVLLAVIGFVFSIAFLFISSWFTFVAYRSLAVKEVSLIEYMRKDFNKSLRYFVFLFLMSVLSLALLIPLGGALIHDYLIVPGIITSFLILAILYLVNLFTRDLVVPRMIDKDTNFLPAFKHVFRNFRGKGSQLIVYLLLRAFISITLSVVYFVIMILSLLIVILVGSPFLIVSYIITPFLVIVPALLLFLIWLGILILARVPLDAYLFNYALSFYEGLLEGEIYE